MSNSEIRIPGYEIIREIGRGGIATVYLAVQESLKREVALKVMSPVLVAEPNFTERFIAEGRTIAQLNHPGVVTIYDIAAENYYTYLAMEYLPGGSLRERLHQKISEKSALAIVYQMADALACAHDNGIVHRDVKPENIMFRANGSPVLTDFGIAKSVGSDAQLTQSGIIVGTPRYISPEQADGRGTDPRSDLYALGVILFEMLAGRPPYGKGKDDSISLLYSHVHDPIPELPQEHRHLQYLVNATMAKDPDERVSDCHKLADMVRVIRREAKRGGLLTPDDEPAAALQGVTAGIAGAPQGARRNSRLPRRMLLGSVFSLAAALFFVMILGDWGIWSGATPDTEATNVADSRNGALLPSPPVTTPIPDVAQTPRLETAASEDFVGAPPQTVADAVTPPQVTQPATAGAPSAVTGEPASAVSASAALPEPEPALPAQTEALAPQTKTAAAANESSATAPPSRRRLAIASMLQLAEKQMQLGQVDAPQGDNALETFRRILSEDKNNAQARAGLNQIAEFFLNRGRESAEAKDFHEAQVFVARGLEAISRHEGLRALQNEIALRLEAEQEFARAEDYYRGRGVERDLASAVRYYREAAEKGHILAQYYLGIAYADGAGTSVDETEGLRWLRRAAVQGNEDAQFNLALGLIFSADPDPAAAAEWMQTLAERNYEPAFQILGWMFTTGTGVKQSIKEAIRWDFKDAVTETPGDSAFPERSVNSWKRLLEVAIQTTKQEQKPQEPR